MKISIVFALALLTLVTVAWAETDVEGTAKEGVLKTLAELKDFLSNDPMGQKLAAIGKDLKDFFLMAKTKTHSAFKEYIKKLMESEE
ncbi:unnamed protein product [Hydatigera taeniaeformis]|uniref:Truncated apolipoprotein C-I n=1 Tax=Hydatigena taeniaeformis TaxID=6205 RepID=A0A0R3X9L2_HYDTA|nr:unnamed protein product [Hydatigera taeniaeformis]